MATRQVATQPSNTTTFQSYQEELYRDDHFALTRDTADNAAAAAAAAAAAYNTSMYHRDNSAASDYYLQNNGGGLRVRQSTDQPYYLQPQYQDATALPIHAQNFQHGGSNYAGSYYYQPYPGAETQQPRSIIQQQEQQQKQQQQQQQLPPPPPPPQDPSITARPERMSRKRRRPPFSYACMIAQAILSTMTQRMTLREIYDWATANYPQMYNPNETGWQNTIRHNLSLNPCFVKVPRTSNDTPRGKGKGGYWTVDIEKLSNTAFGRNLLESQGFSSQVLESQYIRYSPWRSLENSLTAAAMNFDNLVAPESYISAARRPITTATTSTSTSSSSSSLASKTSLNRGASTSPNSSASSDMSTPMLPGNTHSLKYDAAADMYPSLMRVNNIIN